MKDDDDIDLFEWARTHSKKTDPETSYGAAKSMPSVAKQHCGIIHQTMIEIGVPVSSEEISRKCSLTYTQISRRTSDLQEDGRIIDSGQRTTNVSGRPAVKWMLTSIGEAT